MDHEQAADFVRRFEDYWRAPRTADLGTVLAERAHLVAWRPSSAAACRSVAEICGKTA